MDEQGRYVPTDAELERLVAAARCRRMIPAEERQQMINWVLGNGFDVIKTPSTRRQVIRDLNL